MPVYKLGGIQRICVGGDDATRGCEHVDLELPLSLVRGAEGGPGGGGVVASRASPSATQNPRPSHGFDWKIRRINSFFVTVDSVRFANTCAETDSFLDSDQWRGNTLGWCSSARLSLLAFPPSRPSRKPEPPFFFLNVPLVRISHFHVSENKRLMKLCRWRTKSGRRFFFSRRPKKKFKGRRTERHATEKPPGCGATKQCRKK